MDKAGFTTIKAPRPSCDCSNLGRRLPAKSYTSSLDDRHFRTDVSGWRACKLTGKVCGLDTHLAREACVKYSYPGKFTDRLALKVFGITVVSFGLFSSLDRSDRYTCGAARYNVQGEEVEYVVSTKWQGILQHIRRTKHDLFLKPPVV